jgi:hypothetical protein
LCGVYFKFLAPISGNVFDHHQVNVGSAKYYLKHAYMSVLSDIKREAQLSVLCLIKHDNECFE